MLDNNSRTSKYPRRQKKLLRLFLGGGGGLSVLTGRHTSAPHNFNSIARVWCCVSIVQPDNAGRRVTRRGVPGAGCPPVGRNWAPHQNNGLESLFLRMGMKHTCRLSIRDTATLNACCALETEWKCGRRYSCYCASRRSHGRYHKQTSDIMLKDQRGIEWELTA